MASSFLQENTHHIDFEKGMMRLRFVFLLIGWTFAGSKGYTRTKNRFFFKSFFFF